MSFTLFHYRAMIVLTIVPLPISPLQKVIFYTHYLRIPSLHRESEALGIYLFKKSHNFCLK